MDTFIQLSINGITLGAIYALIALGFVIIYKASQVFNFAHGELLLFGAYSMTSFYESGMPFVLSILASMVLTGILAAFVERVALRPLVGRPVFITVIVTIFIGIVLHSFIHIIWKAEPTYIIPSWDPNATTSIPLLDARVSTSEIVAILVAGTTLLLFFFLIKKTRLGIAMRATSNDQEVSLALGIPVGRIFGATWFISGACAALAGIFLCVSKNSEVSPNLAYIALKAFPAAIVGGLDSPGGTVMAGVLLGLAEVLSGAYIGPHLGSFGDNFSDVFPYIVMILFLMVRPYGIFGTKEVERV